MKDLLVKSFGRQLQELLDFIAGNWAWPSPEAGFALHVFQKAGIEIPPSIITKVLTAEESRRLDQAPVLAAIGYHFSACQQQDAGLQRQWADGFSRLVNRNAFPVDRTSFFFRPIELLGISLGAACCDQVNLQDVEHLQQIFRDGKSKAISEDLWASSIAALAARSAAQEWRPKSAIQPSFLSLEETALFKWICLADQPHAKLIGIEQSEAQLEELLLEQISVSACWPMDIARAAVIYVGLKSSIAGRLKTEIEENWQVSRKSKDALALLQTLCSRFHLFAAQLQHRHDSRPTVNVTDEYDVQDLMHALLKFHFNDVRPEECTPSYGGISSRTDFLLKQEQIIIEAKMMRKGLNQKEVAKQLIIDKESYKAHPDCKTLVCFVYDPGGRCNNPAALENDLSDEQGNPKVIVIVAPKGI